MANMARVFDTDIDVGNSRIKWALDQADAWNRRSQHSSHRMANDATRSYSVSSVAHRTSQLAEWLHHLVAPEFARPRRRRRTCGSARLVDRWLLPRGELSNAVC